MNDEISITALNILDGIYDVANFDDIQPSFANSGMGFIEFCSWITGLARTIHEKVEARNPQEFPGVMDYEVSCPLGSRIARYMTELDPAVPSHDVVNPWIDELLDGFFACGALEG